MVETEEKNYEGYTYEKDAKVVISGATFTSINMLLSRLSDDEVKFYFKHNPEEGFEESPTIFSTEKGMAISEVLRLIAQEHIKNVDSGVAITVEESKRPKIAVDA